MRINSTKEQPVSASHWRKGGGADWLPDHDNNKKVKVKKNTLAQGRKKTNTTKIRARQQKRRTTLFRHLQTPDDAVNVDVSTLGKITVIYINRIYPF